MKAIVMSVLCLLCLSLHAETITIQLEQPVINEQPYHHPFTAVWLETENRKGVETIAIWYNDAEWLRDLRQWWRKLGRKGNYDAVTGATRKPGVYTLTWKNTQGLKGKYYLHVESAREDGGREFLRQVVVLGEQQQAKYQIQGKTEIGKLIISVQP